MRLLKYLKSFGNYLRAGSPRERHAVFRSRPTLEALEDRLVPSTATQVGSTLFINASAGTSTHVRPILVEVDPIDHTKMDVFDSGTLLGKFAIASISTVLVSVAGNDAIKVDDSNGLPFAPSTGISLSGNGANNSLALFGSQALNLSGNEVYSAGTATFPGGLSLGTGFGSVVFTFSNAIGSVTDDLITTQLIVEARGQEVSLAGPNGVTETLKGLAGTGGAGNTLTFRAKPSVRVELLSDNATADLNAKAAAQGLQFFQVDVFGKNDRVNINTTPSNVNTHVEIAGGQNDTVLVRGNLGPVGINGNLTTIVALGTNNIDSSKSVTSGIKNNVFVEAAEVLQILDGANVTTEEHMTITESTISGSGMFGSNAVVVTYEDTFPLIETGQLANTYTVAGSHPGAEFLTQGISINDDFSNAGLTVQVSVDSTSDLQLSLFNKNPAAGSLLISAATGGGFNPFSPTTPNGTEDVTFFGGFTSTVAYEGFNSVAHS
jgi:hypothetical protein